MSSLTSARATVPKRFHDIKNNIILTGRTLKHLQTYHISKKHIIYYNYIVIVCINNFLGWPMQNVDSFPTLQCHKWECHLQTTHMLCVQTRARCLHLATPHTWTQLKRCNLCGTWPTCLAHTRKSGTASSANAHDLFMSQVYQSSWVNIFTASVRISLSWHAMLITLGCSFIFSSSRVVSRPFTSSTKRASAGQEVRVQLYKESLRCMIHVLIYMQYICNFTRLSKNKIISAR